MKKSKKVPKTIKRKREEICRRIGVNYKTAGLFLSINDWNINKSINAILKTASEVRTRTNTTNAVAIRFLEKSKWDTDKAVFEIQQSSKRISKAVKCSEKAALKLLGTRAGDEKRTIKDALTLKRRMQEEELTKPLTQSKLKIVKESIEKTKSNQQKKKSTKNRKTTDSSNSHKHLSNTQISSSQVENSIEHNHSLLPIISYKPNPKKSSEQSIDFKDFMVRSNTFNCQKNGHKISEVNAWVAVLRRNGTVIEMKVVAAKCEECNRYYISSGEFERIRENGIPLCRLIQNEKKGSYSNSYYDDLNDESILHMYGYNVSEANNLSDQQRHAILVLLVEAKVRKRYEICQHLDWLINTREGLKSDYSSAISKWKNDRSFIISYELTDAEEVAIKSIIY